MCASNFEVCVVTSILTMWEGVIKIHRVIREMYEANVAQTFLMSTDGFDRLEKGEFL